jgi:hypothetical protein
VVADFTDPSGILAGKVVNLTLGAPSGQSRINYSAIAAIETAFKSKGAAAVSSDTAGGAIPVFEVASIIDATMYDDLALLAQRATATTPEVKIVNGIKALYNGGNQILQVQSPMQLTGNIKCAQLNRIQTTQGNIYADETLRLWETDREITLANFLAAYAKCGFDLDGENNFLPKPGLISTMTGSELSLDIINTAKSFDIYKLFERYHDKNKLASLSELHAEHITVAGNNAAGLYGANNQPLATFPYKVKGEVLGAMYAFAGFENLYESTGDLSMPANIHGELQPYKIKNVATESLMPNANFVAEGACFFRHAPGGVGNQNGAIKIMRAMTSAGANAKYLDLRDLPLAEKSNLSGGALGGEIAFASVAMLKSIGDPGLVFPYAIGYANDNSGNTKLIGTASEGFQSPYESTRNTGIYGVLELQEWVNGNPPRDKSAIQSPSVVINPTQNQNPALLYAGRPIPPAILAGRRRAIRGA